VIEIDGAHGEGGGQIVRTASTLALLTGQPCRIRNIRQRRREPGLRTQHALGLRALADLCGARLEGANLGSSVVELWPGPLSGRTLTVRIPTAGSITLMLQTLLPLALAAKPGVALQFDGGATDTRFSPTLDYFRHVMLWFLRRMGVEPQITVSRRGYYPKGGAQMAVTVTPGTLAPLTLTARGRPESLTLFSSASRGLKGRRVAERQAEAATAVLAPMHMPLTAGIDYASSRSAGSALCIVAGFTNTVLGADSLGAPGKTAEQVGEEAAIALTEDLATDGCLDRHMVDQILIYMALATAESTVRVARITSHCVTNMWVIEHFLGGRFEVRDQFIRWIRSR
jgi:RNA 3'-phosphate cyclase